VVRLNSTEEGQESLIVTSNSNFVIAWSLSKIKNGDLYKYSIQW
jgi:hypothetical protein